SKAGAVGLMQIMPETALELAKELELLSFDVKILKDPSVNIKLGVYYLKKLETLYKGNKILILSAYNAGIGKIDSWGIKNSGLTLENIPYKETRIFVKNVLRSYRFLLSINKIFRIFK
ncbi:lytic transglycosylase domain-containing protein, partial [bacterium]